MDRQSGQAVMMRRIILVVSLLLSLTAASSASAQKTNTLSDALGLAPSTAVPDVPDPEKVFRFRVRPGQNDGTVALHIDIDDCCYLYRDKIKLQLVTTTGAPVADGRVGEYALPNGEVRVDPFVGKTEIYRQSFVVHVPIDAGKKNLSDLALKVGYQGCTEKPVSVCYAPSAKVVSLNGGGATSHTSGGAFWLAIAAAFGAGLLLSFTPCVLPMIPILSGVIVGAEGKRVTKTRAGALSYVYVLGTALTYAVVGAVAGATGEQLQAYFQNVWAIGFFSAVLVLLALSMFGLYTLQMPAFVQSLLHRHSSRIHRRAKKSNLGEFVGVFVLGLFSALIIGACVSPVLVSVLGAAVAAQDPWLGAGVMFAMAHGQGLILIAVGVGAGALLPKAGSWMDTVKHVFGVLLVGVAIYLLSYLPQVPVLLLWGALLIVCAVYLGATQRLPEGSSGWRYARKGVGTFLLVWGVLAIIGGVMGQRDIFRPLPSSFSAQPNVSSDTTPALFQRITAFADLERAFADAKTAGKPVLLDYYADWCVDCLRMEKGTFNDPVVRAELLKRFVLVQADVTNPDDADVKALKKRFGVYGPPATLFFSSRGDERHELRTYGYIERDAFLKMLNQVD
jgi:thiol:disulfide interchange protein DsbD